MIIFCCSLRRATPFRNANSSILFCGSWGRLDLAVLFTPNRQNRNQVPWNTCAGVHRSNPSSAIYTHFTLLPCNHVQAHLPNEPNKLWRTNSIVTPINSAPFPVNKWSFLVHDTSLVPRLRQLRIFSHDGPLEMQCCATIRTLPN